MADDIVVRAERLGKKYIIGHKAERESYVTLRDVITRRARNAWRKTADMSRGRAIVIGDKVEEFWALKDVNFEVKHGEVLGIIGRNGAGKSTLLKILSRITEPSEGRVSINGRVASLLEVGTGFHPELTGRENVYLNGAVLGMARAEIKRKFDEIVAFAEIDRFLDTPVKRYSSGMYVRLAFAVAAHLQPEILIVDEVLAVGDVEFQKKCLGKMNEVSRSQGRTVLFVSHNMEAVLKLCTRVIRFETGCIRAIGDAKTIVPAYLSSHSTSPRVVDFSSRSRPAHFTGRVRLVKASPSDAISNWSFPFGQPLSLDLSIDARSYVGRVEVGIGLYSGGGFEVASWTSKCSGVELSTRPGINTFRIEFQHPRLLPGRFSLGIGLACDSGAEDWIPEAISFEITTSPEAARIDAKKFTGAVAASATISVLAEYDNHISTLIRR
jgi:lipopolysaccharide transport system ATP-binding protein